MELTRIEAENQAAFSHLLPEGELMTEQKASKPL